MKLSTPLDHHASISSKEWRELKEKSPLYIELPLVNKMKGKKRLSYLNGITGETCTDCKPTDGTLGNPFDA